MDYCCNAHKSAFAGQIFSLFFQNQLDLPISAFVKGYSIFVKSHMKNIYVHFGKLLANCFHLSN